MRIDRTIYPASGSAVPRRAARRAWARRKRWPSCSARWDVAAEETLAIGDNWNDHEMLEAAGLGLVMGNADPRDAAPRASPVLPTNDEDGVAVAIEREILGD